MTAITPAAITNVWKAPAQTEAFIPPCNGKINEVVTDKRTFHTFDKYSG